MLAGPTFAIPDGNGTGAFYISDTGNCLIRYVDQFGNITTVCTPYFLRRGRVRERTSALLCRLPASAGQSQAPLRIVSPRETGY